MIYLIGGPPRCGKSTAARRLSVLTGACWFPADYVGSMITGYIPEPDRDTLWPYSSLGAHERYATFTAEEIIKSYRTRARTSWMALESLVAYALGEGRDFVVEGYHVEPEFARRMISEHGESNVCACFLCKHDQADIVAGIAKGVPENDWLVSNVKEEATYGRVVAMVRRYSEIVGGEAQRYGLRSFDMDHDFQAKMDEVMHFLADPSAVEEGGRVHIDADVVRTRLEVAVERLLERDLYLLTLNVHERSISHKLGCYLQEQFPVWDVDCEYNRDCHLLKQLNLPPRDGKSGEDAERRVLPDVIVHRRGDNDHNLLVVEVKTAWSRDTDDDWDRKKLRAFKDADELDYRYGYFLKFGAVTGSPESHMRADYELVEISDYDRDHRP